jgi:hypothetical protein
MFAAELILMRLVDWDKLFEIRNLTVDYGQVID